MHSVSDSVNDSENVFVCVYEWQPAARGHTAYAHLSCGHTLIELGSMILLLCELH